MKFLISLIDFILFIAMGVGICSYYIILNILLLFSVPLFYPLKNILVFLLNVLSSPMTLYFKESLYTPASMDKGGVVTMFFYYISLGLLTGIIGFALRYGFSYVRRKKHQIEKVSSCFQKEFFLYTGVGVLLIFLCSCLCMSYVYAKYRNVEGYIIKSESFVNRI